MADIGFEADSVESVNDVRVFAATKYSDMLVMLSIKAVFRSISTLQNFEGLCVCLCWLLLDNILSVGI